MSSAGVETASLHRPDKSWPIEAYPSLRLAAKMIGVTPATLSRRGDVARVRAGREQRIPAAEVVRLAGLYRRRAPSRVAAELAEHAIAVDPELEEVIGNEVDAALEQVPVARPAVSVSVFLETAHRLLPRALAEEVEVCLRSDLGGSSAVGWSPAAE